MRWVLRVFATAAIRKLAVILVLAALGYLGVSTSARAQTAPEFVCTNAQACSQQEAYENCRSFAVYSDALRPDLAPYLCKKHPESNTYYCEIGTGGAGSGSPCYGYSVFAFHECPPTAPWDETTHTCKQPSQCATKPPVYDQAVRGTNKICRSGCVYEARNNQDNDPSELNFCMAGQAYCASRTWNPTGQECEGETGENYDKDKNTCVFLSNGFGECVKPDGTHCKKASSGVELCWRPGETGPRKTADGTFGSDRKAAPGTPTAPDGMVSPVQNDNSQTTINNNTYNSSSFSGSSGPQQPGQPNTGVDGDGDGDGKPDDQGSASGGASCAAPPSCSGDQVMCAALNQQWLTRCGETKGDSNSNGQPDWTEGAQPAPEDGGEDVSPTRFGLGISPNMIDTEDMFGGGTCPQFSLNTQFISFNTADYPVWCNLVTILRSLILLFAGFTALQILMGRV